MQADWVVTPVDNMTTGPPPQPVVTLKVRPTGSPSAASDPAASSIAQIQSLALEGCAATGETTARTPLRVTSQASLPAEKRPQARDVRRISGRNASSASFRALPQVRGDTHLVVRRPGDCNFFADPGCRLPLPHLTFSVDTLKKRQHNLAKMNNDIRDQVTV